MALFPRRSSVQKSYDAVAEEYTRQVYGELAHKPADQRLLNRFADALSGEGPCVELGCGPGHVTRYLSDRGVDISGIDISAAMIRQARKQNPGIQFQRGDMSALKAPDHGWAAAVSFYSIIHLPSAALQNLFLEWRRVIEPGGALLLAFHIGTHSEHLSEWWGHAVDLEFHYHRTPDVLVHLQQAGFKEVSIFKRDAYPDVEAQTRRAYILAESLPGVPPARRRPALKTA